MRTQVRIRRRWLATLAMADEATLHVAFDDVQYLPRVVELDRSQPEFTRTVWDYLDTAVSAQRVALGQDKLLQHLPPPR
jgi:membrane-bound lytic murein transglycosylase B